MSTITSVGDVVDGSVDTEAASNPSIGTGASEEDGTLEPSHPTTPHGENEAPSRQRPKEKSQPFWRLVLAAFAAINFIVMCVMIHFYRKSRSLIDSSSALNNMAMRITAHPSELSSDSPSSFSSSIPSSNPSSLPSETPSSMPSETPSSMPSETPSSLPTQVPSWNPSWIPSSMPTDEPSVLPSLSPTRIPTTSPSSQPTDLHSTPPSAVPSMVPTTIPTVSTESPTFLFVPPNPVPERPHPGYFNYDRNDQQYGPSAWHRVNTAGHILREIGPSGHGPWRGHLGKIDPVVNRCNSNRWQSPKNLVGTIPCVAWHEIRTRCGAYGFHDYRHQKYILPHKLTAVMNRRKCLNPDNPLCDYPRPPSVDYPNYIGTVTSYSDLMNYDIKVPAEHRINGEIFDAEVQMTHVHLDPNGNSNPLNLLTSLGILIRATEDGHNDAFQYLLDSFQDVYDENAEKCEKRRRMQNEKKIGQDDNKEEHKKELKKKRDKRIREVRFDPYDKALMPTIYFYRYNGSLTEPPCQIVTWWVMSEPMIISKRQLLQLKAILFTHVDETCERTSVHNQNMSSARPLFEIPKDNEKDGVQHCTNIDFKADKIKGRGRGRECKCGAECLAF